MNSLKLFLPIIYDSWQDLRKHAGILFIIMFIYGFGEWLLYEAFFENFILNVFNSVIVDKIFRGMQAFLKACLYVVVVQKILNLVFDRNCQGIVFSNSFKLAIIVDTFFYYLSNYQGVRPDNFFDISKLDLWKELFTQFFQNFSDNPWGMLVGVFALLGSAIFSYALWYRIYYIDFFILEKKCSLKEAFNKSWDLGIGNFKLYTLCFIIPYFFKICTTLVFILVLQQVCAIPYAIQFFISLILYCFVSALKFLIMSHLFERLVAFETEKV